MKFIPYMTQQVTLEKNQYIETTERKIVRLPVPTASQEVSRTSCLHILLLEVVICKIPGIRAVV